MTTLRRVVLEQDGKPYLKGNAEEQAKRAKILAATQKVKAERNARAAKTGGSGTSRPGYSSVSDSIVPLTADRVNEMKRQPGTGPHTPSSDRPGFMKRQLEAGKNKPAPKEKKPFTPGNVKRRDGSSTTTDQFGSKTEWGPTR